MNTKQLLDLGIDPISGEKNIMVSSPEEYWALPPDQKNRCWATMAVAAAIADRTPASLYTAVYQGRASVKWVKRTKWAEKGTAFIQIPNLITQAEKRQRDIARILRVLKNTLKITCWLPEGHQTLLAASVRIGLMNIERDLFPGQNNNKGEEGNHEQPA